MKKWPGLMWHQIFRCWKTMLMKEVIKNDWVKTIPTNAKVDPIELSIHSKKVSCHQLLLCAMAKL
jgi:hypothetical protein